MLEYDKEVIQAALEYLSISHEKPQCIFVGTYGPHFPYVASPKLYSYYKERVTVPDTFERIPEYVGSVLKERVIDVPRETVIKARAAYFGMIETIDGQLGEVRKAFNSFLNRNDREGFFAYLSDHGDQAGDRKMFGKTTFFETSAKIPMIFEGPGIPKGQKNATPVSIMDLGPTLCELAGAIPMPAQDGRSLRTELLEKKEQQERAIISEVIDPLLAAAMAGRMIRKGKYKYIVYVGSEEHELLFDLESDPEETCNLANMQPAIRQELRRIAFDNWQPEKVLAEYQVHQANVSLIRKWENAVGPDESERWQKNPEYARIMPIED